MARFITSNGITFRHYRIDNTLNTSGEFGTRTQSFGTLPTAMIKDLSIGKEAEKKYIPYESQKSLYLPTGMIGPMVKMILSLDRTTGWNNVYTNDILEVAEFGFPTYAITLGVGTRWWVNAISIETSTGKIYNGKIRYSCDIDLIKQTVE